MTDYDLLTPKQKVLDKIYQFYMGFYWFYYAFQLWGAIMTNDYETSSKRTFGLTWFDDFYGLLSINYD